MEKTQDHQLLPGIQYMRAIAALFVVFMHADGMMRYPRYFGQSPIELGSAGLFGVAIFFVISGFIITIVSCDRQGEARVSIGDFAWRRFIRIVPFMWLCTIGYNLLSFAGTHHIEWGDFLRAMTIWPLGELKPNVLWSLRHEFLFYALFAATILASLRLRAVLVVWFFTPLILPFLGIRFTLPADPADPLWVALGKVFLVGAESGANLQFGAGYLLGILWLKNRASQRGPGLSGPGLPGPSLPGPAWAIAAALSALAICEALALPIGPVRFLVWTLLAMATVWVSIVTTAHSASRGHRLGLLLGNASFAIYLVHNPALLILMELFSSHLQAVPGSAVAIGLSVAAVAAGVCVHLVCERPLLAWLTRRRVTFPKAAENA